MSTIRAYYNDNEPYICEWARNLIKAGLVPDGEVDERSITDVTADDLRGFTQCHFFCGILGWPLAFRMAGWPADRPVWSASLPCQPFSVAGKGAGADDPRHLWPHMFRLIGECRPDRVFGEQVAGAVGHGWLDGVCADLEGIDYAVGACVLGAHSVSAPHIRQRLWWCAERVADPAGAGGASRVQASGTERATGPGQAGARGGLADRDGSGPGAGRRDPAEVRGLQEAQCQPEHGAAVLGGSCPVCGLADARCECVRGKRPDQASGEARGVQGADGQRKWLWSDAGAGRTVADLRLADRACGGQREHGGAPGQPGHADQRGASERLADAEDADRGWGERGEEAGVGQGGERRRGPASSGDAGGLVYPERDGRGPDQQGRGSDRGAATRGAGASCGMGDACGTGLEGRAGQRGDDGAQLATAERAGGHWGNTWLQCSDGTARRVEPAIPCLASRLPTRVDELCSGLQGMGHVPRSDASAILKQARRFRKGVLRGAGNSIVPQVAAEFIRAYMEAAT